MWHSDHEQKFTIHVLESLALENFVIQLAPGLEDQIVECNASLLQRIFIKLVCKAIGIAIGIAIVSFHSRV